MELIYWRAQFLHHPSEGCDIRAKTKSELLQRLSEEATEDNQYGEPEEIVLEFNDTFDLMDALLSDDGGFSIQTNLD